MRERYLEAERIAQESAGKMRVAQGLLAADPSRLPELMPKMDEIRAQQQQVSLLQDELRQRAAKLLHMSWA